ncbi:hypothetical protein HAZT_HAZT003311, partial [Hyalella azteca]
MSRIIVYRLWHHHDDSFVYMLFDYVCGGELFSYLRSAGRFPLATAVFYATEIISALAYLHSMSIVYRDVKPENLLLDRDGHLKITDFGFSKVLSDRNSNKHPSGFFNISFIFLLGILIYEMLAGHPPFFDENPFGIYEKILCGQYQFPRYIDGSARDLIKRLLVAERTRRLGAMKNGAEDIKRHKLFRHIIWDDVYEKKTQPPIVPKVSYDGDTRNFDDYPEKDW